jgi:exopolyphosphatase/guanosine-5'-triphosphate,3'-diphosphate pyrophosphatase
MGASAIRLVIAEIGADGSMRVMEEASRGILLGRDTFSSGFIPARTIDATLAALEGFDHLIQGYSIKEVRAVATSAVREAQNGDVLLDRIQGRTGIAFETINEAEESRLLFLAVRKAVGTTPEFRGAFTMLNASSFISRSSRAMGPPMNLHSCRVYRGRTNDAEQT